MTPSARSTLLPVILAGVVAIAAGAVVLLGFDRGGNGVGPAGARAAAIAAATTVAATTASAATSPDAATGGAASTAAATSAAAVTTAAAATTAPLPKAGCPALAAELDATDASLAGLIGEDAPGPDDAIPGAAQLSAFARQLDRLEASAPDEIADRVEALVVMQLAPLAALGPKSGEEAFADALSGLADAVQSGEYLDESDAVRTWISSHCG